MKLIPVLTLYMYDIYKGGLAAEPVEYLLCSSGFFTELLLLYIYQFCPEIRVVEIIMYHFFYQVILTHKEFFKAIQTSIPVRFVFISRIKYNKRRITVSLYYMVVYYLFPVV